MREILGRALACSAGLTSSQPEQTSTSLKASAGAAPIGAPWRPRLVRTTPPRRSTLPPRPALPAATHGASCPPRAGHAARAPPPTRGLGSRSAGTALARPPPRAARKTRTRRTVTDHRACTHSSHRTRATSRDEPPGHDPDPHRSQPRPSGRPPSAWSTANAPAHGERPLRLNWHLDRAAQGHTASMASNDYFEHVGPGGQTPARRGCAPPATSTPPRRLRSRREHRLGHALAWPPRARSSPPGWPPRGTARTSSTPHYRDTGIGISPHAPVSLAARPVRRDLHAGLRRHHHAERPRARDARKQLISTRSATTRQITSWPRPHRGDPSYGSTRRQVGDRHRLGTRDRTRHRGAARRPGRPGPDQRPRRRRRRAGRRRDQGRDGRLRRRPDQARAPPTSSSRRRSTPSARSTSSSTTPATRSTRPSTRCPTSTSRRCSTSTRSSPSA